MAPNNEGRTVPSDETRAEEAREARVPSGDTSEASGSDRDRETDPPADVDEEVGQHYREMTERGAHQQGEGRLP